MSLNPTEYPYVLPSEEELHDEAHRQAIEERDARIARLRSLNDAHEAQAADLRDELAQARAEAEQLRAQLEHVRAALNITQAELTRTAAELEPTRELVAEAAPAILVLRNGEAFHKQRADDMHYALADARKDAERATAELDDLREQFDMQREDTAQARAEADEWRGVATHLRDEIRKLMAHANDALHGDTMLLKQMAGSILAVEVTRLAKNAVTACVVDRETDETDADDESDDDRRAAKLEMRGVER